MTDSREPADIRDSAATLFDRVFQRHDACLVHSVSRQRQLDSVCRSRQQWDSAPEQYWDNGDLDRINELSAKADDGTLEAEEKVELERYVHVGHLLSILKAKIRGRLKKTTS